MENIEPASRMIARCTVCKGNIHEHQSYDVWEGGFYCERHSLPHLRARAREYALLLEAENSSAEKR